MGIGSNGAMAIADTCGGAWIRDAKDISLSNLESFYVFRHDRTN